MHTISRQAHAFLVESYEKAVETFFDDPTEYADSDPLKVVFDELKELGEELEIDILSLAVDDDLERLEKMIKKEEGEDWFIDADEDEESLYPMPSGHMAMGYGPGSSTYKPYFTAKNTDEENKSVEEKLKKLSQSRQPDEMIGEWTTYEIEEE